MNEYREYIVRIRDDCIADFEMRYGTDGELIRCKDCKYWERVIPYSQKGRCAMWRETSRKSTDYCSEAERKECEADEAE